MFATLRSIARQASQRHIAARISAAPSRSFSAAPSAASTAAAEEQLEECEPEVDEDQVGTVYATPEEAAENNHPVDLPLRVDETGVKWADYRPENVRNIKAERDEDGNLWGEFEGETVIFPDLETTLEWVLATPVDEHLFEEAPIIKLFHSESEE